MYKFISNKFIKTNSKNREKCKTIQRDELSKIKNLEKYGRNDSVSLINKLKAQRNGG